jgi:hypothetical protein
VIGEASPCRAASQRPTISELVGSLAGLHEGHHPICAAKRDWLLLLDDEPCPRNQRTRSSIQVRKQWLRKRVEQSAR